MTAPGRPAAALDLAACRDAIRRCWAEVLGRSDFGDEQTYVDLGASGLDSLVAVQRIRAATGAELPLQMFFEFPTVRSLASALWERQDTAGGDR